MPKIKPLLSISDLNLNIQTAIQSIPLSDRYFIALSGGMDSVALTYFCLPYLRLHTKNIQVIHINHGLSPNAEAWSEFCQDFCDQLDVVCHLEKVRVRSEGKGLEAAARKARYEVFSRYLSEGGVLLQGHHLNDQAETVLMRVFKGLGPEALKGIPQVRRLSHGCLYRPWLELPRELIASSVKGFGLVWVDDESNLDVRFERNYLRHDVLPILGQRRPNILNDLGRTARKSKEAVDFIQEWCEANKHEFLSSAYIQYQAVNLSHLVKYSQLQKQFIVRFWLDLLGVAHPSESSFQRIFNELLVLKNHNKAEVCWNGYALRVFDNTLFCLPSVLLNKLSLDEFVPIDISLAELKSQSCVELPFGKLTLTLLKGDSAHSELMSDKEILDTNIYELTCSIPEAITDLTIRFRQGGEKIYLHQGHSASLKKLYQTNKVLPWLRDKLPLIFSKEELLCSLGGFIAGSCQLDQNNNNNRLISKRLVNMRFELS
jgi:tRNA(Ile)-lysidine synthase